MVIDVARAQIAREQMRLAALDDTGLLDTPAEERFDRITRVARELFDVPIVAINLVDADRLFTKSPQNTPFPTSIPRSATLCDVTVQGEGILVVPDASADERFAHRLAVTGDAHVRFYAGRPLSTGDDLNVGSLCLIDSSPRELDEAGRQLLDEMGIWVERELRASADRDRASDVQQGLLPPGRPGWPDFDVAGLSVPIQHVSGDFYDWNETPTGLDLTVADVMGKGVGAAIIGAGIRSAFQARTDTDPAMAIEQVDAQLRRDFDATNTFATLFHARLDFASGVLSYADAGHGLTVIVRADGTMERLAATGLPLGISHDTWQTETVSLATGDTLLSFTDGVLDLFDGTLESVATLCDLVDGSSAHDITTRVRSLVADASDLTDDLTLIVIARRN